MDIDRLPAGAELDWLALHHALDWKSGVAALGQSPYSRPGPAGDRLDEPALWPVSTELGAAWVLVEHVEARSLGFSLSRAPGGPWLARIWHPERGEAACTAETAPLAIARAALKAVNASLVVKGFRL